MTAITITPEQRFDLRADLAMIGLQLLEVVEECRCSPCRTLDRRFDVDAIATGPRGLPCFVAWRQQPDYDYQTITVRVENDRGNADVQARKLMDGRSKADLYLQSYPSGVAWALSSAVRAVLLGDPECPEHQRTKRGAGGQLLRIICHSCCPDLVYVPRLTVTLADPVPSATRFDPDDDFMAAWDATDPLAS